MHKLNITTYLRMKGHQVSINGNLDLQVDANLPLDDFLRAAYDKYSKGYLKFFKMDALCKLGTIAADILLKDFSREHVDPANIALVLMNSSSSLHADTVYQKSIADIPSPAQFVYTLPNIVIGEICIKHAIKGESIFLVNNNFDVSLIDENVQVLFDTTDVTACLAGWIELGADKTYDVFMYLVVRDGETLHYSKETIKQLYNSL